MEASLKKIITIITIIFISLAVVFAQTDSRYDTDKNLPFNEKAGDVNPQTGNISLSFTDISLPGRAGYNFTFGRIWSLNQSNVYNMYYKDGANRLNSNTVERYNHLGAGWSSTLPYVMKNFDSTYMTLNLFFGGNAYEIDQTGVQIKNLSKSNLLGYDLLDLRIYEDSSINYGMVTNLAALQTTYGIDDDGADQSKYELLLKTNEKYYFRADGKLMMQEDKTGLNKIWYFYEEIPASGGDTRLKLVVDTIGREIEFSYDANGNISTIGWNVEIGIKNTDGTRSSQTVTKSIIYEYISGETLPETAFIKNNVLDYKTPYLLSTVTDPMGFVTKYNYIEGKANFTFDKTKSHSENVYLMLTQIIDKYTSIDGAYKNKRCFEYEVPADGMYTKWFYTGYMENYKITRQYNVDRHGRIMNDTSYVYYDNNEAGNFNQYTSVITMGGVKYTYTYSLSSTANQDDVLDKLLVETNDGFVELKDYVYDSERKKIMEEVFRSGNYVYSENYTYDTKGNLKRHEDRVGLITTMTYDDTYSIPLTEKKTLHVNGVATTYDSENVINGLGQVTKQIIYLDEGGATKRAVEVANLTYDAYGNLTEKKDANGVTVYTVYDASHHAFPVKIYQNVDIAGWSGGGDVHTNWLTDPDSTKKVRIRSWKVFNSDGSVWIEVDNEGYAIEHYYDLNGTEIEVVNPDLNDVRNFATPIVIVDGTPQGADFDDFTLSSSFNAFLTSRQNNPGARMNIDYQNDLVITYADIDKTGSKIKVTGKQGDGLGNVEEEIEYSYEFPLNPPFIKGDLTEYSIKKMEYDNYGRMVALTDPDAGTEGAPISVNGVTVTRHDKTWIVKYDDLGRKLKTLYPNTSTSKTDLKVTSYDDQSNEVTTTDPEGRTIVEKYDWNGNLIEVVRYGNASTSPTKVETYSFYYDELNRKVEFVDAKGIVTKYKYDERNLLKEQDYGVTGKDIMVYNDLGQLTKKTDRKGNVITFTYDQMGRNTKATHYTSIANFNANTIDHTVALAYDNRGNAVRIANNNLIEHYLYDYANRVITLDRRLKDSVLRQLIADRVDSQTEASQVFSFNYTYNDAGMVTKMTYPNGAVHDFNYDPILGRLENIGEGINEASVTPFLTDFTYNKSGVVTRMNYANNTAQTWDFDNRKRISHISIVRGTGQSPIPDDYIVDMKYTLNGVGDILKINNNEYGYDGFDRIIYAKTLIPENSNQQDVRNLILESFGAYQIDTSPTAKSYNILADLNTDDRINGKDHILASFDNMAEEYDIESFEYDKNGNRTKLVQNGDTYTYTYGERNRLLSISVKKSGSATAVLFAGYQYDGNGNTTKRTIYQDDGVTVKEMIDFTYDTMNRLTSTTLGGQVTMYYYDNAGNRFIKKDSDGTTVYLRHGQIAVALDIELYDDETEHNGTINRYVLSGDLLAGRVTTKYLNKTLVSTEKFWYHLDHLNSTKCVTAQDGSLNVMYEYRAFGEQLKKLGEGEAKYTYGGKELDDATNLYYFNARYYDATIGRFINVDPIQDGTNWYVYCNNNPLSMVDPTGLDDENNKFTRNGVEYDLNASFSGDQRMFDPEGGSATHCFPTSALKSFNEFFDFTNQDAINCVDWLKENSYLSQNGYTNNYKNTLEGMYNYFKNEMKVETLKDTNLEITTYLPSSFNNITLSPGANENSTFLIIASNGPNSSCRHAYPILNEDSNSNLTYWQVWRPDSNVANFTAFGEKTRAKSQFNVSDSQKDRIFKLNLKTNPQQSSPNSGN